MLRIIQLSDCHLPGDRAASYRGRDPYAAVEALLGPINAWAPDLLLATGDLSEDGSVAAYRWLAGQLEKLGKPVLAIPGNHDDADRMRRYFAHVAVRAPLVHDCQGWRLIMLDSAPAGHIAGQLSDRQLEQLEAALEGSNKPKLVALHHQPVPTGSAWIDRYPLLESERFWDCLAADRQVRLVCWGHIHQAFEQRVNGVLALGAPSTVSNSLPGQPRFSWDGREGACRWLELTPDGAINTGLLTAGP